LEPVANPIEKVHDLDTPTVTMAAPPATFVKKRIAERERVPLHPLRRRSQQNVTAVCAKVYYWKPSGSMSFARGRSPFQDRLISQQACRGGTRAGTPAPGVSSFESFQTETPKPQDWEG